jgi:CO/xanthine dehydrogenase FAD-binding subunit
MRTATTPLQLFEPRTLATALKLLRDEGPLTPLAGTTDVYVSLNFGTLSERHFIDIGRLDALREIAVRGDVLSIGALASYTSIIRSPEVSARIPMLIEAAGQIGGVQIQNRGTLGGNVANGSPAGDTLPVLAVAEAVLVLRSVDGERRVPFAQFYTGYRASVLRPDELIVAIEIGPLEGRQWFRKVGTRAAQAISKVVMAGVRGSETRLALGSVAATVVRLPLTERSLATGADIDERLRLGDIRPVGDAANDPALHVNGRGVNPAGRHDAAAPENARAHAAILMTVLPIACVVRVSPGLCPEAPQQVARHAAPVFRRRAHVVERFNLAL